MMMRCLEAGGLEADYVRSRDELNDRWGDPDYRPNRDGFFELSRSQYRADDFPDAHEGKLIKILMGGMNTLKPGDYKVVFMERDTEEIADSYHAFFGQYRGFPKLDERRDRVEGILAMRRDVDLTVLQYRDVVENPRAQFQLLQQKGWPIDVDAAASIVDEDQYRFRSVRVAREEN